MTDSTKLQRMTMSELATEADRVGIPDVEEMSISTLLAAIERKWRAEATSPDGDHPEEASRNSSLAGEWENFSG